GTAISRGFPPRRWMDAPPVRWQRSWTGDREGTQRADEWRVRRAKHDWRRIDILAVVAVREGPNGTESGTTSGTASGANSGGRTQATSVAGRAAAAAASTIGRPPAHGHRCRPGISGDAAGGGTLI